MIETLGHRGPDDQGAGYQTTEGWDLGTCDYPSSTRHHLAATPIQWAEGRLWITYNGEIYKFQELRRELKAWGYQFRSNTDTEVILAAYDRWGLHCVQRLVGMFASGFGILMGFSVPLADWFRGGLRERITSDFHGPLLEDLGINPQPARRLWSEFLAGRFIAPDLIWSPFHIDFVGTPLETSLRCDMR